MAPDIDARDNREPDKLVTDESKKPETDGYFIEVGQIVQWKGDYYECIEVVEEDRSD